MNEFKKKKKKKNTKFPDIVLQLKNKICLSLTPTVPLLQFSLCHLNLTPLVLSRLA